MCSAVPIAGGLLPPGPRLPLARPRSTASVQHRLILHRLILHRLILHRLILHRLILHRVILHRLILAPVPTSLPIPSIPVIVAQATRLPLQLRGLPVPPRACARPYAAQIRRGGDADSGAVVEWTAPAGQATPVGSG